LKNYTEEAAAVFVFAGMVPQTAFAAGLGLKTAEDGSIITDQTMFAGIPGLFVAGDVRSTPFRQVVVAAGEGAVAAHAVTAYINERNGNYYSR
jgi:thioredoxin reductase (NADPH)